MSDQSNPQSTQEKVIDFLQRHPMAVLATTSLNNEPWASPIYCTPSDQLHLYFLTKSETTKFANISQYPHVSITVANDEEQTTVQAYGIAEAMTKGQEVIDAYNKLAYIRPPGKFNWTPPIEKLDAGEYVMMKFTPTFLQFSSFKGFRPEIDKVIDRAA